MRMMGAIQGLKISRVSTILIGFACASMIAFACTRTTIVSSFIPNQILVMHPDKPGEDLKGNDKLVETADLVGSSGIEAAVKRENGENSTSTRERDTAVSDGFFGERKQDEIVQEDTLELDSAAVKQTTKLPASAGEKEGPSVSVERTGSVLPGGKDNSKQLEMEMEMEKENITTVDSSVRKEQMRNSSAITGNKANLPSLLPECNYAKGKWVFDDRRPLYSGFGCKKWLSSMWACRLTQRTDFEYEKLRWQPKDCKMEDFSGSKFLKRMQDKTLAIVGDSLGRQQFQSLMCMVTGGEERRDVVDVGYEYGLVKAHGAVRPDGWAYRFPITNTTILYYWSASLCDLEPINASNKVTDFAMHLDRPPAFLRRFLPKFDVLVLNTGHHWNRGKLVANRWIMYVGGVPNTNRKIAEIGGAKDFAVNSIIKWLDSQLPLYPGLKVFFRSISPRHFFNGDWNTGGTCDNTTPLLGGKEVLKDNSSDPLASSAVRGTSVKLLDITASSELRDEGHVSRYSIKATPGVQDCLHWCLPGVPDTWNEILFAQL